MEKMMYGMISAVIVIIIGFALFPTVSQAIESANLSSDQAYLGTLAKTLYVLGISLVSVVIVFMSVRNLKGN
jgi:hypothetical protein